MGQPEPPDSEGFGLTLFYVFISFLILIIPTGLMGATLPVLIRQAVQAEEQIGERVGLLYALNTAGAVIGVLVAGFILLPSLGLWGTVWVGVGVNVLVFAIAALLARNVPVLGVQSKPGRGEGRHAIPRFRWGNSVAWIQPLMLLSGSITFLYEILWTRLLSHVLGGSIYAFATMLASFLTGITLGSFIAARFARERASAITYFVICQMLIAMTSIGIYFLIGRLQAGTIEAVRGAIIAMNYLFPATLFIGATFPLAVRILTPTAAVTSICSARIYAWNTCGAILGSLATAFLVIPNFKFAGTIFLGVAASLVVALLASIALTKFSVRRAEIPSVLLLAGVLFFRPSRPDAIIRASSLAGTSEGNEVYYEVGRSATTLMLQWGGMYYLRINGLPEAAIAPRGAPYSVDSRWLGALPVVARPATDSMLIIGLGGGVAVEGVPPTVKSVDVVELEPGVITANRTISGMRRSDPISDKRVRLIINDARSTLSLTDKKYDAIVSQPSHPWSAGASHLYTREFIALAQSHLNSGGVLLQWMNIQFVNEDLLKSLAATLPMYSLTFDCIDQSPRRCCSWLPMSGLILIRNCSHRTSR